MDIGERQRKLSLWAEQDKELRFYGLHGLLYNQVKRMQTGWVTNRCSAPIAIE
jgi:hypothetical protein